MFYNQNYDNVYTSTDLVPSGTNQKANKEYWKFPHIKYNLE